MPTTAVGKMVFVGYEIRFIFEISVINMMLRFQRVVTASRSQRISGITGLNTDDPNRESL